MGIALLLNGTSSAGKTSIARGLQILLPPHFLYFGLDTFLFALPPQLHYARDGVRYEPVSLDDGRSGTTIAIGGDALALLRTCHLAMSELVRSGASLVLDEALFDERLTHSYATAFEGLELRYIKVTCGPRIVETRERERGDRVPGLAMGMELSVHSGIKYDLEVDTSHLSAEAVADQIVERLELLSVGDV